MEINRCVKESFSVIGKEGSTMDGRLYLAGVEAKDGEEAPEGWTVWRIPGYEYLYVKCTEEDIFTKVITYMKENGLELSGAVHDFICPKENGQGYMFFPIRRL